MSQFAENMKQLRRKHGWSQRQAASMIGIPRPSLGAYEEGRALPRLDVFAKICHVYRVSDPVKFIDSSVNQALTPKTILEERLLMADERTRIAVLTLLELN